MDVTEQVAFDLGWDFAIFDRDVPDGANKAFCDGYRAYKSGNKRATRPVNKYERKWLQIRFGALGRNKEFSPGVTPEYLEKITPASGRCPVTEAALTYAEGRPSDWSVDRANNARGYVRGNIIIISTAANKAKGDKSLEDIVALSNLDTEVDGLYPDEWGRLAELIAPAFGSHDDTSPIPILVGQPVALGMPVSPISSFQIALARLLIDGWDSEKHPIMVKHVSKMASHLCRTKKQRRAFLRLFAEVRRRSRHIGVYSEIWATKRVQRRLFELINSLGSAGLTRLTELQEAMFGNENVCIT